jgi:hypothetical protein
MWPVFPILMVDGMTPSQTAASRWRTRVFIVLAAALAAVALWAIVGPVGGLDLVVRSGASTVTVGPSAIVLTAVVAGVAAWILLAVLERFAARPAHWWRVIATSVLLLSLLGPLGAAGSTSVALALVGLHLVVGVLLIVLLPG